MNTPWWILAPAFVASFAPLALIVWVAVALYGVPAGILAFVAFVGGALMHRTISRVLDQRPQFVSPEPLRRSRQPRVK